MLNVKLRYYKKDILLMMEDLLKETFDLVEKKNSTLPTFTQIFINYNP